MTFAERCAIPASSHCAPFANHTHALIHTPIFTGSRSLAFKRAHTIDTKKRTDCKQMPEQQWAPPSAVFVPDYTHTHARARKHTHETRCREIDGSQTDTAATHARTTANRKCYGRSQGARCERSIERRRWTRAHRPSTARTHGEGDTAATTSDACAPRAFELRGGGVRGRKRRTKEVLERKTHKRTNKHTHCYSH